MTCSMIYSQDLESLTPQILVLTDHIKDEID